MATVSTGTAAPHSRATTGATLRGSPVVKTVNAPEPSGRLPASPRSRCSVRRAIAGAAADGCAGRPRPRTGAGEGLPERRERRPRGGVAGSDEEFGPGPLAVPPDRQHTRAHLFEGPIAVGTVGGVGDVQQVLCGQGAPD